MKDLLQEYKRTLKATNRQLNGGWKKSNLVDPESYINVLKAAKSDLEFAIRWLEKGYQPDAHYRGIQRNDAYYLIRAYDPSVIDRYLENKQANEPFEFIEESFSSVEEMQEQKRIEFEDQLPRYKLNAIRKAKQELDEFSLQVVLMSEKGHSVRKIAELLGANFMKVQRTKDKCKEVFERILVEIEPPKSFVCHCSVQANDGQAHIRANPTISVEAENKQEASVMATQQLKQRYKDLGCIWVDVEIPLINQA